MNLDIDLVSNIRINLSAIERRTSTLTKRRSVKKEYQAAWLLKAISLIDLTTLSGDDTAGKVERLCEKAKRPISLDLLEQTRIAARRYSSGCSMCVSSSN